MYESQAVIVVVLVDELLMVKFNVAVESHPATVCVLYTYAPDVVYVEPFQVYVSQAVIEVVLVAA